MAYPTAREPQRAGNKVIIGARSKDLLVLEHEVRAVGDETYVLIDDGTVPKKAWSRRSFRKLVDAGDNACPSNNLSSAPTTFWK